MWCPTASDHENRLNHENDVDYTGIIFPVTLNQIDKIEKLNEINFNIFTLDNEKKYVLQYISLIITMIKYLIPY